MQLIGEATNILEKRPRSGRARNSHDVCSGTRANWTAISSKSTRDILPSKTLTHALVDKILDTAGKKASGKWTYKIPPTLGIPITLIAEAGLWPLRFRVEDETREGGKKVEKDPKPILSAFKKCGEEKSNSSADSATRFTPRKSSATRRVICSCARRRRNTNGISITAHRAHVARGCIHPLAPSSAKSRKPYDHHPKLTNLLLDDYFRGRKSNAARKAGARWSRGGQKGIPVPAFSTALAFYIKYRVASCRRICCKRKRDYFGAHTYERVDQPRGQFFHTKLDGQRRHETSAAVYNAEN